MKNDKKRQLSEDEITESTESPKTKTMRTYIYSSDIDIEEHHPIKIEDEVDLSTTENMMQIQNNSGQGEMETIKKVEFVREWVVKSPKNIVYISRYPP